MHGRLQTFQMILTALLLGLQLKVGPRELQHHNKRLEMRVRRELQHQNKRLEMRVRRAARRRMAARQLWTFLEKNNFLFDFPWGNLAKLAQLTLVSICVRGESGERREGRNGTLALETTWLVIDEQIVTRPYYTLPYLTLSDLASNWSNCNQTWLTCTYFLSPTLHEWSFQPISLILWQKRLKWANEREEEDSTWSGSESGWEVGRICWSHTDSLLKHLDVCPWVESRFVRETKKGWLNLKFTCGKTPLCWFSFSGSDQENPRWDRAPHFPPPSPSTPPSSLPPPFSNPRPQFLSAPDLNFNQNRIYLARPASQQQS